MATVTFESSDGTLSKSVSAEPGASLANLCDDCEAPIPFSCRSASCATCHIEVLEGAEALTPPNDEELDVLEAIDAKAPRYRLACCAKVGAGATTIRVRAQNDY
jgi:ferredoxin